jgi:hypothetical protein
VQFLRRVARQDFTREVALVGAEFGDAAIAGQEIQHCQPRAAEPAVADEIVGQIFRWHHRLERTREAIDEPRRARHSCPQPHLHLLDCCPDCHVRCAAPYAMEGTI